MRGERDDNMPVKVAANYVRAGSTSHSNSRARMALFSCTMAAQKEVELCVTLQQNSSRAPLLSLLRSHATTAAAITALI